MDALTESCSGIAVLEPESPSSLATHYILTDYYKISFSMSKMQRVTFPIFNNYLNFNGFNNLQDFHIVIFYILKIRRFLDHNCSGFLGWAYFRQNKEAQWPNSSYPVDPTPADDPVHIPVPLCVRAWDWMLSKECVQIQRRAHEIQFQAHQIQANLQVEGQQKTFDNIVTLSSISAMIIRGCGKKWSQRVRMNRHKCRNQNI